MHLLLILCLISESTYRSGSFVSKLGVFRSNVEALQAARETLRGVRGLAILRTELRGPPGPSGEFPFANCPPGNPLTNPHHHAPPYVQKGGYFLSPSEWFPLPSTLEDAGGHQACLLLPLFPCGGPASPPPCGVQAGRTPTPGHCAILPHL